MSKIYNIAQLDKKLLSYSRAGALKIPKDGWIKTIRTTIGMTGLQLAVRLGISLRRLREIEDSEKEQKLKLDTLNKVADALNCDLQYVFVPKGNKGFKAQLEDRALAKARQIVSSSSQHMSLEDQLASDELNEQAQVIAQELMHKSLKGLWDE